ncbi:hemerythrin [Ectothiorhodospira mobilis]|uniref:diguanylate cyclase n=1 Tax=Ectothiorhodospira mobilis TaxID=195064 RepID=A0A1I4QQZ5_ECTMO|nr:GGDEF domain-containing protein [Ectothiorhodospira mobilis]SFM42145.1 hemerythrin [Ectothiorhodospira mobilis]
MRAFQWNERFVTGLAAVDQQHHHLVELINQLGGLMGSNRIHRGDLEALYRQLADYADYHFREEETLMQSVGVDPRHMEAHVAAHRGFLEEVTQLHEALDKGVSQAGRYLLDYLSHWLAFHILGQDQNMARQIAAIRAGSTAEAAFEAQEKESDAATGPLLTALSGLFSLVSERNRQLLQLNHSLEARVAARTRELSEANRRLEVLSRTDVLTGLPNRRHAMKELRALWDESSDTGRPLACMMIDADHFKEVNDTYGHDSGDQVLVALARTLKHSLRNDDVVCRLGGDEFLVLCPDTPYRGALHVAKQVEAAVSALRVPTGDEAWRGSASIGVAVRTTSMTHPDELIQRADDSVYLAKRAGRGCIRSANTPEEDFFGGSEKATPPGAGLS